MPSFGLISFGFAGVGYLALMLLLALNWGGGTPGARLIGVCAATVLWAAILGTGAWTGRSPDLAVLVAELTRFGAWVFLLDGIAKTVDVPEDRSSVTFHLNPAARFSDASRASA